MDVLYKKIQINVKLAFSYTDTEKFGYIIVIKIFCLFPYKKMALLI